VVCIEACASWNPYDFECAKVAREGKGKRLIFLTKLMLPIEIVMLTGEVGARLS
jgi:hypothetical protein